MPGRGGREGAATDGPRERGPERQINGKLVLRRLVGYCRPHMIAVAGATVAVLMATAAGLAPPSILRTGIDRLIEERETSFLLLLSGAMMAVALLHGFLDLLTRYLSEYISQSVIHDIRSRLYGHISHLSFSFHDSNTTGDLMSRITADTESLRHFISSASINISANLLTIFGVLAVVFFWEPRLALLYLLMVPLMIHAMISYSKRVRPMFGHARRALSAFTSTLWERLSGVEVVKLFGQEERESSRMAQANREYASINIGVARVSALWMPYVHFLIGLGTVAVIWYGGYLVTTGSISLGIIAGFTGYIAMLMRPIRQTGMMVNAANQAIASADRVFEVLDTRTEVVDLDDAPPLSLTEGRVEYRDVTFRYGNGVGGKSTEREAVDSVSFVAEPGSTVAIVGATGAGKTTLVHLLPRFYDRDSGHILIDGQDIREVSVDSLRRSVGILMQSPFLFSATIRENISYGRPDASMEDIERCAKAAQIHDFIESLPLCYDTPVGERGVTLSGGQRQRIAMAQMLLRDPGILILDEPSSNLDSETEERLQKGVAEVVRGRTTLVIAHRLWTVQNSDMILVMKEGRLVESGTHEELMEASGEYQLMLESLAPSGLEGTEAEVDAL